MKTTIKYLAAALLIALSGCKKSECEPDNTATAATTTENTVTTDAAASPDTDANAKTQRKYLKKRTEEKLTQHQIDSIKTERGALVTPPHNVGPSLTPGSGRAVPGNDKTAPGTTANMGSSTGK